MEFVAINKLSLLDFPNKVSCILFTRTCNFRCPFCHNGLTLLEDYETEVSFDEIISFLKKRQGILDGVVISGGEPTLMPDLADKLRIIKDLGFAIKLDTNGSNPDILLDLLEEGLIDYVAMDIKNSRAGYAETAGVAGERMDISAVMRSIELIMQSGAEYEFRTTVVKELHEESDFHDIGQMIRGAKRYFLQSFTDRDTVPVRGLHSPDPSDLARYAEIMGAYVREVHIRGVDIPLNRNDTVL